MKRKDFLKTLACLPFAGLVGNLGSLINVEEKPIELPKLDILKDKTNDFYALNTDQFNQYNVFTIYKDNVCVFYIDSLIGWQPEHMTCPIECGKYLGDILKIRIDQVKDNVITITSRGAELKISYNQYDEYKLYTICCNYSASLDTMKFFKAYIESMHEYSFGNTDCKVIYSINSGKTYKGFLQFPEGKYRYNSKGIMSDYDVLTKALKHSPADAKEIISKWNHS